MKFALRAVLAVVLLVVLGAGLLSLPVVQTWLVVQNLPPFPEWPDGKTSLGIDDQGEIYFETHSPFDLEVILAGEKGIDTTGLGYLTLPESTEPVPAMVILPGSGGIQPGREHEYAEFLNRIGIAGFVVEYYAPRGFADEADYMLRTTSVTEFDLMADAYSALRLLSTHPLIDGSRIGVVGFSYGGMAARLAMDDRIRQALAPGHAGFAAHIDVYGPCFQDLQTRSTNGAPLLTLRGTIDRSNDLAACADRESELRKLGIDVTAIVYEGAGHAWENEGPRRLSDRSPYVEGCTWVYDESGVASVNGEKLVSYGTEASRATRIAARLRLGTRLLDCVKYGYIVGRDEEVREKAFNEAEHFLKANL